MSDDRTRTEQRADLKPITVRLNSEEAARLDAWIKEQGVEGMSRAVAIRRLLNLLLE
jgi:Ribbon-helix-helix protein, copG family